jgi:purine-binding chemotaxis protein CheW
MPEPTETTSLTSPVPLTPEQSGRLFLENFQHLDELPVEMVMRLKAQLDQENAMVGTDEKQSQYLAVLLGETELGFRMVDIDSILTPQKITPVPGVPDFVLGICNVRGEITSMVNLHRLLGFETRRQKSRREKSAEKMMILRSNAFAFAFYVDAVLDVVRVPEKEIVQISSNDKEMSRMAMFTKGVYTRPDEGGKRDDVLLIDTQKLMDSKEMTLFQ